jgi:capsular polysaccharide biosynthesis protein
MRRIRRPRFRWLVAVVLGAALVGALMGAWGSTKVAPTYAATTTILVGSLDRPSIANDFEASSAVTTLYGDLIRGQAVLGPVIDRLGLPTDVAELRDRVHVDLDPNGIPIVTITVYARSAAEATATAQAVADRMVAMSRASLAGLPPAPRATAVDLTDTQVAITRVERRLDRLRERAQRVPPKRRGAIERRVQRQSDLLMLLQTDYRGAARPATGSANQLQVLQPAEAKPGRIRPVLVVDAALGATIGALAALGLIVALAMRRRRHGSRVAAPGATVGDPWASEILAARQEAYAGAASAPNRR